MLKFSVTLWVMISSSMNRFFSIALLTTVLFALTLFSRVKADILDDVSNLMKAGNTKEISRYFASDVELTILSQEHVSSKAQAEVILQDFFNKHHPGSVKIVHKLTSNPNLLYAVLILNTNNGVFRTSFSMKNISGKFLITEIGIEINKD